MPTFTPPAVAFNYPKNGNITPNTNVVFDGSDYEGEYGYPWEQLLIGTYQFVKPAYVNITVNNVDVANSKLDFRVSVNTSVANNLGNGFYQNTIKVKCKATNPLVGVSPIDVEFTFTVSLNVFEQNNLTINPSQFSYSHDVGDANPADRFLSISTDFNWSIVSNQSWLSFDHQNGSGNDTVALQVDISGMGVGAYSATFLVDDGHTQKTGTVSLTMTGSGAGLDYIDVSPEVLMLSENHQELPGSSRTVTVSCSSSVNITTGVSWLELTPANLPAGANSFQVKTKDTEVLSVGSYPAEITVSNSNGIVVINVLLQIVEQTISGLRTNEFYFSEARNRLQLTSGQSNTEALLDFETQATLGLERYQRTVPYFKNALSVVIGLETENLLKPQNLPNPLFSGFFIPVKPIVMKLKVFDKPIGVRILSAPRADYQNLKFIKGRHPNIVLRDYFEEEDIVIEKGNNVLPDWGLHPVFENPGQVQSTFDFNDQLQEAYREVEYNYRLTYLPKVIYAPADGKVCLSIYTEIEDSVRPRIFLWSQTGIVQTILPEITIEETTDIYSWMIDISLYELEPGQRMSIALGFVEVDVHIRDTEYPTTKLVWLNEWDCPEVMNLTGKLTIIEKSDNETTVVTNDGKEVTHILEVLNPKSFEVNTGHIYTDAETRYLAKVLVSKKVWLEIAGKRYPVIPDFNKIEVHETRRFIQDFNLKFDVAEV